MKKILLALVIIACWWWLRPQPVLVENSAQGYQAGDYRITVLQDSFTLTARVLGREDYSLGREADVSTTDLALGWSQTFTLSLKFARATAGITGKPVGYRFLVVMLNVSLQTCI